MDCPVRLGREVRIVVGPGNKVGSERIEGVAAKGPADGGSRSPRSQTRDLGAPNFVVCQKWATRLQFSGIVEGYPADWRVAAVVYRGKGVQQDRTHARRCLTDLCLQRKAWAVQCRHARHVGGETECCFREKSPQRSEIRVCLHLVDDCQEYAGALGKSSRGPVLFDHRVEVVRHRLQRISQSLSPQHLSPFDPGTPSHRQPRTECCTW